MNTSAVSLYLPGHSPVHRLAADVKVVAAMVAVVAVVATPREMIWPYLVYAALLVSVWSLARIPLRWIAPRMLIEVPFVVLAVLLPFAGAAPYTDVLGMTLSTPGLWAAWGIVAKGTLGVGTSLTLAATMHIRELPGALTRLRVPGMIVTILVLMLRYIDLLVDEASRMRLARVSRGDDPRALWQAGATARGAGALFLRAYERGERVHLAMLSRGYDGAVPTYGSLRPGAAAWLRGLAPALVAVLICVVAWATR
ncbi:cobalt ECF transporter T component CbiQ [Aldersonia kunmingensis]|uniref:cobalt ECF transporter T component CbiQ n=1 Tax=Aldersonia kunmingensis TaxID=408066 RepID=UPI00082F9FC5|nr:cobalt ECF transporter T component CbiQ [Aldersonia kunmingensis]